jgi:hypothetical protein
MENKLYKIVDKYFGDESKSKRKVKISAPYDKKHVGRDQIINEKLIGIPDEWKKILNIK